MTPQRWSRIKSLFHEALGQPAAERGAFVAHAVGGDESLAAEVLGLLAQDTRSDGPLRRDAKAAWPAAEQRFVIERELGQGGMGRVVVARDEKLGRKVAIKFLKPGTADPDALRRFEREARAAGALNHPNIIVV